MGITYRGRVGKIAGLRLIANITVLTWITDADLGSHLGAEPLSIPLEITATNTHDPTVFQIISGALPAGLSLVNGVISGTPTNVASNAPFTVRASNNNSVSEREFTLEILLNAAPVWSTPAGSLGTFIEQDEAHIQLSATDPEAHTVAYSLANGAIPTGWTLSNTGAISGTAGNSVATYSFSVRASDGAVHTDRAFSIDIGPNENPTWNSPAAGSLGSVLDTANAFTRTFSATDPEGRTVNYSISSGALPGNLTLNANSGVLSGLFQPVVGTQVFNFNVRASDGVKHTDRSFSLSVEHDVGPTWVTAPNLGTFLSDTELNVNVVATDANNSAITYGAANGTTFPGMVAVSSAGLLSGLLPTVSNSTVYNFGVVASDGFLSNSRTFSLTVRPNSPPVWVTNATLGQFTVNTAISNVTLSAPDPDGDTVTFALSNSTTLPAGLSLANGVISGTPTVVANNTFTLRASDPFGGNAYRTFFANVGAGIEFVGATSMSSTNTVTITKPAGTQTGDYMMIFCPYGAASISGGSGNSTWNHDKFSNGHGYDNHCYHKKLTSTDVAATLQVTSVQYAPVVCVVYRGPGRAVKVTEREDSGGTTWVGAFPRGKSTKSLGWVHWVNDRNGGPQISTGPSGWTRRIGPNATGVFTGDIFDNLATPPSASGALTWTNYGNGSGYIRSGYLYELLPDEPLTDLFYQPVIADKTYSTAGTLNIGATSFSFAQNNTGIRGSAHPTLGSTAIYEIDVTTASNGTNIGFCTDAWLNLWKSSYPSSVPGAGGGIYWTTAQKGVALWYAGGTHQSGSETGTTQVTGYTTMAPANGDVVGIVMNGRSVRAYMNGVFYGELLLAKDSVSGLNKMGGEMVYPFIGQWGSNWAGSFRATPSSYFSNYKLNS